MDDTSKMLTQDEIDSMVTKSVANKPASVHRVAASTTAEVKPKPAAPPVQNVQKVSAAPSPRNVEEPTLGGGHSHGHDECIAAGDINALQERMAEIVNRIAKLEIMISKLDNSSNNPSAQVNPAAFKAAVQQIQNVSSQVEVISEGLRGTAGYNISKIFKCGSCGSVGVVAMKVKCTKCGQENWWGWWPKKK
ncbi:MAG: hypothetical protein ABSF74_07730 [Dehalococcoidia bacterium]|jgi:hypothetical protein